MLHKGNNGEAGYEIKPLNRFVTVNEYCFETLYVSNYFICEITGECNRHLTEIEIEHGAVSVWLDISQALEIFATYPSKPDDIMSLYLREYTVIGKYNNLISGD